MSSGSHFSKLTFGNGYSMETAYIFVTDLMNAAGKMKHAVDYISIHLPNDTQICTSWARTQFGDEAEVVTGSAPLTSVPLDQPISTAIRIYILVLSRGQGFFPGGGLGTCPPSGKKILHISPNLSNTSSPCFGPSACCIFTMPRFYIALFRKLIKMLKYI